MIQFNNTYEKLPVEFYQKITPSAAINPKVFIFNHQLANSLGLNTSDINENELASFFSGKKILAGASMIAMSYAGHQFGHFVPSLGDGRAILLGEVFSPKLGKNFDLHFKGSGQTPYSRRGDGKAALGPMLREYLMSEAMFALGVPTTRSLAVVLTGDQVYREEIFPGAILTRVANSHIRIGTFQYFAARNEIHHLKTLLQYSINRLYPEIKAITLDEQEQALLFWQKVANNQLKLIAKWMGIGFIHGVMNTDNTALSGETIDYGPCAMMDEFNPNQVFSSIDRQGRYAYQNQPGIIFWNLARLADTLLPLVHSDQNEAVKIFNGELEKLSSLFENEFHQILRSKFGLSKKNEREAELFNLFFTILNQEKMDMTLSFYRLSTLMSETDIPAELQSFKTLWIELLKSEENRETVRALMAASNPLVIPRNHLIEMVIQAAYHGNHQEFFNLLDALQSPFNQKWLSTSYATPPNPQEKILHTFCGT